MAEAGPIIGRGRTADVIALSDAEVVKLFTADRPQAAVDGEFERSELAWNSGVSTARPLRRVSIDGREGIVFERVDGRSMLDIIGRKPWLMFQSAKTLAALARQIHDVDGQGMRSVDDYVKARLRRAEMAEPVRQRLLDRAAAMPPIARLCHLDLHPDNVIMSGTRPVIIDWANAARGDPAADVAQSMILLRFAALAPGQRLAPLIRSVRHGYAVLFQWSVIAGDRDFKARVRSWLPVMAGARLAEGLAAEREALIGVIAKSLG
jgi:thiamine kinase